MDSDELDAVDLQALVLINKANEIEAELMKALVDFATLYPFERRETLSQLGLHWYLRCKALAEEVRQLPPEVTLVKEAKARIIAVAKEMYRHTVYNSEDD